MQRRPFTIQKWDHEKSCLRNNSQWSMGGKVINCQDIDSDKDSTNTKASKDDNNCVIFNGLINSELFKLPMTKSDFLKVKEAEKEFNTMFRPSFAEVLNHSLARAGFATNDDAVKNFNTISEALERNFN